MILYIKTIIIFFLGSICVNSYSIDMLWHFGIKGGGGFSTAFIENHPSNSKGFFSNPVYVAGFFVNFSHVHFARIQIEILYLSKGFKRNFYSAKLNYISFPILLRLQIKQGAFTNLGIAFSYLINGTVLDEIQINKNTDVKKHFERLEFDLQAGLGWEFKLTNYLSILTELRLHYSVTNTSTIEKQSLNNLATYLNLGIQY